MLNKFLLKSCYALFLNSNNSLFFFTFDLKYLIYFLLVVLIFNCISITLSGDLITACLFMLSSFISGGILLCCYDLDYFGFIYILVYAGAIAILFVFIVFLLNLDLNYTGISSNSIFFYFLFVSLFSGWFSSLFFLTEIDNSINEWKDIGFINHYKYFYNGYKKLGYGVFELGILLYTQYRFVVVLVGFLLVLCTIGPVLIISGPFVGNSFFKNNSVLFIDNKKNIFKWKYFNGFLKFYMVYIHIFILGVILFSFYQEFFHESEYIFSFFRLLMIVLIIVFVYYLLILISSILGSLKFVKSFSSEQGTPYECGFAPFENSRTQFEVHYFLIAILFLIFDIEIAYLYPYIISFDVLTFDSFLILIFFLLILGFGFLYEWFSGVLFWSEEHIDDYKVI